MRLVSGRKGHASIGRSQSRCLTEAEGNAEPQWETVDHRPKNAGRRYYASMLVMLPREEAVKEMVGAQVWNTVAAGYH